MALANRSDATVPPAMMLATLLFPLLPLLIWGPSGQQADDPCPPLPHNRVLELVLTAGAPPLEGHGPARWTSHEARFSGTLHIWAQSDADLFLRVEDEGGALLGEDDDSGGGTTPYLELQVEPGTRLRINVVTAEIGEAPVVELHVVASPETEATRATAEAALARLAEAEERWAADEPEKARLVLAEALGALRNVEGFERSKVIADAAWKLGLAAYDSGALAMSELAWTVILDHRESSLPEDHSDILAVRLSLAGTMLEQGVDHSVKWKAHHYLK